MKIYKEINKDAIINLIRLIMGLNPMDEHDSTLQEMVYEAINIDEVEQPVISIISQACNNCGKNHKKNKTCLVKEKHTDCNEKDIYSACGECINKYDLGAISDKI